MRDKKQIDAEICIYTHKTPIKTHPKSAIYTQRPLRYLNKKTNMIQRASEDVIQLILCLSSTTGHNP